MPAIKCKNCVYFQVSKAKGKIASYGECHVEHPEPFAVATNEDEIPFSMFPVLHQDDWCGQFQEINQNGH